MSDGKLPKTIDTTSRHFDPDEALKRIDELCDIAARSGQGKPLDNISRFEFTEEEGLRPKPKVARTQNPTKIPREPQVEVAEPKLNPRAQKRLKKSVLTFMKEATGCAAFLRTIEENKLRIKVKLRSGSGLRESIGFLEAFDKHFNLVLYDVTETFKRKRRKLSRTEIPKITVVRKLHRKEICQRYLPKVMVFGERVVSIAPLDISVFESGMMKLPEEKEAPK